VKRLIAAGLLLSLSVAACHSWKKPTVTIENAAFLGEEHNRASIELAVRIENPNSYALGVESLTYRLGGNGVEWGSGSVPSSVRVPARGSAIARVPVEVDWQKVKLAALGALLTGRVDYAVDGEIVFSTPIGRFRRPFESSGKISLRR
jgi:LEA14-like dessication related protein